MERNQKLAIPHGDKARQDRLEIGSQFAGQFPQFDSQAFENELGTSSPAERAHQAASCRRQNVVAAINMADAAFAHASNGARL